MNYIHVHLIFISSVWSVEALQWLYIFIYSQGTPQARTYLCQCVGTLIHLKWPARGSMCTLDFPRMIKTFMNIQELDFNFKYLVSLQIKYTWLICIKMFNVFMNFITLFSKKKPWVNSIYSWLIWSSAENTSCPPDWRELSPSECYKIMANPGDGLTWSNAQEYCGYSLSNLIIIPTENVFTAFQGMNTQWLKLVETS